MSNPVVPALSWDIFCTVIDNYGDIGVCWRLARQIAHERGEPVRLWVDDLTAFSQLEPRLRGHDLPVRLDGVDIAHWQAAHAAPPAKRVVIEAFACDPPAAFIAAMAQQPLPPVWINLEYLSAEDWVEGCHGLAGRPSGTSLSRHFFFPGFTARTGGLLREAALLQESARFAGPARDAWLAQLGLAAPCDHGPLVSLFCYDNPALPVLLDNWQHGAPLTVLVADGKPRRQLEHWLGQQLIPGKVVMSRQLRILTLPFLSQPDYDRLLGSCDLNLVRGEDSFVRAQWAGKPLVWHIYPQADNAHLDKLAAFAGRYQAELDEASGNALMQFQQVWNGAAPGAIGPAWQALMTNLPALQQHALRWRSQLAALPDLLSQLAQFAVQKMADR
ncbi:elongation factor P maturation arginine rhamnosyltransferase EarP [Chitinimonas sp.]|uniref:elongation factor P maturation arginine rhamnosyltransferase EarP n=1 Tax=Chitinimonas sp. TaxID=1934313 RepID=UPI0035B4B440